MIEWIEYEICALRDYMDYMFIAWRERGIKHQCIKWIIIIIIIIEWSVGRWKEHHLITLCFGCVPMLYGVYPLHDYLYYMDSWTWNEAYDWP